MRFFAVLVACMALRLARRSTTEINPRMLVPLDKSLCQMTKCNVIQHKCWELSCRYRTECNEICCKYSRCPEDESWGLYWFPDTTSFSTNRSEFSLLLWNSSTTSRWIGTKLCTDINGSHMMHPTDFGQLLTFPPSSHQNVPSLGLWPTKKNIPISTVTFLIRGDYEQMSSC